MASRKASFPCDIADFDKDERIFLDRESGRYRLEDANGDEWEWLEQRKDWEIQINDAAINRMQSLYAVEGVDPDSPAFDPSKKRKAAQEEKKEQANKKRKENTNAAIFVTGLPLDTDKVEINRVFSDCGPIALSLIDGKSRIKLYYNKKNEFVGEAFIVYQRSGSAAIAINRFHGTDFNRGPAVDGPLKVEFARKIVKAQPQEQTEAAETSKPKTMSKAERAKRQKKEEEISAKWNDDDSEDEDKGRARRARWDRLVILSPMFTLDELAADADAYEDIKQDVRDECENFGEVTNLVLWDLEPKGIITVRFADPDAASACVKALDGRKFAEQPVRARLADGYETYKKTKTVSEVADNNTVDTKDAQAD